MQPHFYKDPDQRPVDNCGMGVSGRLISAGDPTHPRRHHAHPHRPVRPPPLDISPDYLYGHRRFACSRQSGFDPEPTVHRSAYGRGCTLLIGYARVSTADQDLTAQRSALEALGVAPEHIYVDHGLTGTNRSRPGLEKALAAVRSGDTLVVTKLDRLARSVRDASDIASELTGRGVALSLGGSTHDPADPIGKLLFSVLAMVAEFEADLIRQRTREGMAVARAKGRLRGKQPSLAPAQDRHIAELKAAGESVTQISELMSIGRASVYRAIERHEAKQL